MRVFLDTNVLVSAYAARGLCADLVRSVLAEHDLLLADVVLVELERVLLQKIRLPSGEVQEILTFLRGFPVQPRPSSPTEVEISDPDDAWVLASALEARAEVLVTGDPDLLELASTVHGVRITSPRSFWELIRHRT